MADPTQAYDLSQLFGAALEADGATVRESLVTFGGFLPPEAMGALNRYLFYLWLWT